MARVSSTRLLWDAPSMPRMSPTSELHRDDGPFLIVATLDGSSPDPTEPPDLQGTWYYVVTPSGETGWVFGAGCMVLVVGSP